MFYIQQELTLIMLKVCFETAVDVVPWSHFFLKPRSNLKEGIALNLIEIMVVHYCHSKLETEFDIELENDFEFASEFEFETEFKLEFKFEFKIELETWV